MTEDDLRCAKPRDAVWNAGQRQAYKARLGRDFWLHLKQDADGRLRKYQPIVRVRPRIGVKLCSQGRKYMKTLQKVLETHLTPDVVKAAINAEDCWPATPKAILERVDQLRMETLR
jgi:hypothetical protein